MKWENSAFYVVVASVVALLGAAPILFYFRNREKSAPERPPVFLPMRVNSPDEPLSEAKCRDYAKQIEAAVRTGDVAKANSLFAANEIQLRELNAARLSNEARARARSLVGNRASKFADGFVTGVQKGGKFSLVHVRINENLPRALFRFVPPNGGLSYVEVYFGTNEHSEIIVNDIFPLFGGEKTSHAFRRLILENLEAENPQRLHGIEKLKFAHQDKVLGLMECIQQDRMKEAYALYLQMPEDLKNDRAILLMGLAAAQHVGGEEQMLEAERFRTKHPTDPAVDLVSLELFAGKKEFTKARGCLDRLEKKIGGDPHLIVRRGRLFAEEGRYVEAKLELEKAMKADPSDVDAYWDRALVAAMENNLDETAAWLKECVRKFSSPVDEEALRHYGQLEKFLLSPQCNELQKWARNRGK